MASITTQPNGRREIQHVAADGKRRTIRLGACDLRTAEGVRIHVERLATSIASGQPVPMETARWLSTIGAALHQRLARAGLCATRDDAPDAMRLAATIDAYIVGRADVTEGTRAVMRQFHKHAVRLLGADRPMRSITVGDANAFRHRMLADYSPAYVCKMVKLGRQVFRDAVDHRRIDANPFAAVKAGHQRNRDRLFYVRPDVARTLIDATPDVELKLTIALARFGGLRVPSELQGLRWGDVAWDAGRMTIRSPKTIIHGRSSRVVPIFPELRPLLLAAFDAAEPGTEHVVPSLRRRDNLRTKLLRLATSAGVTMWAKPFQNMRASCATDLCSRFPGHVAAEWLGHTDAIAEMHYRQVTDEHYERAASDAGTPGDKAMQNPMQHASESARTQTQAEPENLAFAESCEPALVNANESEGQSGIRPSADSHGKTLIGAGGDAKSDAPDVRLAAIVAAWPTLPEAVRAGIVAIVRASRGTSPDVANVTSGRSAKERHDERVTVTKRL